MMGCDSCIHGDHTGDMTCMSCIGSNYESNIRTDSSNYVSNIRTDSSKYNKERGEDDE